MFARRVPPDLRPSTLAQARCASGRVPFDLTLANPTACGLSYPPSLLEPLGRPAGLSYDAQPQGLAVARDAVARDQRRHGPEIDPERVLLTASTSEAYSLLFKLLCDPGQSVLLPTPSYPLLEHLATLEGVRPVGYRLDPASAWQPDLAGLDLGAARALVVVHPNNPTGSLLESPASTELPALCSRFDMALIVDEVFLDYPLLSDDVLPSLAGRFPDTLTFTLGGLSKSIGLPQVKLAWIIASGPEDRVVEALSRLAFIADQYLSVAMPVQLALGELLEAGAPVRQAILARCRSNLQTLTAAVAGTPGVEIVSPRGGWNAVLRYPHVIDEEVLALELLREDGVAVHPGYLFDFGEPGYLVLSLLPEAQPFAEAVGRLLERIASRF